MGTNAIIQITDENFENVVSTLTGSNVDDMLEMISLNLFLMHEFCSKIRLLHENTGLNIDLIEILASDLVDKCFDIVPEHAKEIVCEYLILIICNISTTIISLP
jgi:hypothetical protein